jgi:hypothetical protein
MTNAKSVRRDLRIRRNRRNNQTLLTKRHVPADLAKTNLGRPKKVLSDVQFVLVFPILNIFKFLSYLNF